jgi:hypothetical protein
MNLKELLANEETSRQVVLGLYRAPEGKSSFLVKTKDGKIVKVEVISAEGTLEL